MSCNNLHNQVIDKKKKSRETEEPGSEEVFNKWGSFGKIHRINVVILDVLESYIQWSNQWNWDYEIWSSQIVNITW